MILRGVCIMCGLTPMGWSDTTFVTAAKIIAKNGPTSPEQLLRDLSTNVPMDSCYTIRIFIPEMYLSRYYERLSWDGRNYRFDGTVSRVLKRSIYKNMVFKRYFYKFYHSLTMRSDLIVAS